MMYLSDELILEHYNRYDDLYRDAERRRQIREARLAASDQSNSDPLTSHPKARGFSRFVSFAKSYLPQQRQTLNKLTRKPSAKPTRKRRVRRVLGQ